MGVEREREEIARKMLTKGMDILDILEVTGLSPERIREMREIIRIETASV